MVNGGVSNSTIVRVMSAISTIPSFTPGPEIRPSLKTKCVVDGGRWGVPPVVLVDG